MAANGHQVGSLAIGQDDDVGWRRLAPFEQRQQRRERPPSGEVARQRFRVVLEVADARRVGDHRQGLPLQVCAGHHAIDRLQHLFAGTLLRQRGAKGLPASLHPGAGVVHRRLRREVDAGVGPRGGCQVGQLGRGDERVGNQARGLHAGILSGVTAVKHVPVTTGEDVTMADADATPTLDGDPDDEPSRRERAAALVEQRLDVPMAVLAVVWAGLVAYELIAPAGQRDELALVGNVIWALFVVEFGVKLWVSGNPVRFVRRRWPSVLFLVLPALRVLRVVRALRALRLLPAARVVGSSYRAIGTARSLLGGGSSSSWSRARWWSSPAASSSS